MSLSSNEPAAYDARDEIHEDCVNQLNSSQPMHRAPCWELAGLVSSVLESRRDGNACLPGVVFGHVGSDQVCSWRGLGVAARGRPEHVDSDTWFRIGSITKVLTAIAVLRHSLICRRDLDRPLSTQDFGFPTSAVFTRVTLRGLLSHTAGTANGVALKTAAIGTPRDWLLRSRPAGGRFSYSNLGYALAGKYMQAQTGLPTHGWLAEHALEPLRLAGLTFIPPRKSRLATGHAFSPAKNRLTPVSVAFTDARLAPAGFMWATISGMSTFARALLFPQTPLTKEIVNLLTTPVSEVFGADQLRTGCGLFTLLRGTDRIGFHDGEIGGFSSLVEMNFDRREAICIMTNFSGPAHAPRSLLNAYTSSRRGKAIPGHGSASPARPLDQVTTAEKVTKHFISPAVGLLDIRGGTEPTEAVWNGIDIRLVRRSGCSFVGTADQGRAVLSLFMPDLASDHVYLNGNLCRPFDRRRTRTDRLEKSWLGRYVNGYWIDVEQRDGQVTVSSDMNGEAVRACVLGPRTLATPIGIMVFMRRRGHPQLRVLGTNWFVRAETENND